MEKLPKVKELKNVDLASLDKNELLKAALSYKRAYFIAKKNNIAWKNRQFAARRWFEKITNKYVINKMSQNPLYDDLWKYKPEHFEDGKYYHPEDFM